MPSKKSIRRYRAHKKKAKKRKVFFKKLKNEGKYFE